MTVQRLVPLCVSTFWYVTPPSLLVMLSKACHGRTRKPGPIAGKRRPDSWNHLDLQIAIVWELNRLRHSLMLMVLAWANSLHDPATYSRSYSGPPSTTSKSAISALIGALNSLKLGEQAMPSSLRVPWQQFSTGFELNKTVS